MINQTGFVGGISGKVTTSVGAKEADPEPGFEEMLTEKTSDIVGDNAFTEDIMQHIMQSIASMHEGSKSIWEIVLQLEKHVDPKQPEEILNTDFDDTAGLNSIAGLLARDWKKRELLEENDAVFSGSHVQNEIDNNAAAELAALHKKKEQNLVAEIRESTTDV